MGKNTIVLVLDQKLLAKMMVIALRDSKTLQSRPLAKLNAIDADTSVKLGLLAKLQ